MQPSYEVQLRRLARVLSEIAHSLESVDKPTARVERALTLLGEIVPYRKCALLEVREGTDALFVLPPPNDAERETIRTALHKVYDLVSHAKHIGRSADSVPSLSLPLIGLDSAIGVIRVEPSDVPYDATHLRILSVVAAQLSAYLTTLQLRERDRIREERLAAAHDFQQLLAGVVSHDLRNPLMVITTIASNLLTRTVDARQAEQLRRALRNAQHAARLISDLADVTEARVSGTISVDPRNESLRRLIETIAGDVRSAHPTSTIELLCDCDENIVVTWDVERITQVLTNLVNNAVAHGAVGLPVRVAVWCEHEDVMLSVHNYGPAIPGELLPAIFDPFIHGRARPKAHTIRGLGLGLFIVDQIVRSHHGTIEVTSDDLAGTMFKLRMPTSATWARKEPQGLLAPARRSVVMVVEDENEVRSQIVSILAKRGFDVIAATDGQHALELLHSGVSPHVIVLDLWMPRMTGDELCAVLRKDPALATIPVVLVSADTAATLRVSGAHARAVLAKPLSLDQLLATLGAIQ